MCMGQDGNQERELYHPGDKRALSTAILETIDDVKPEDVTKADFQLYDDIDPDTLDNLFRKDATANTTVEFDTDDVTVTLHGDGTIQIQVVPRTADE